MEQPFKTLLSPIELGPMTVKNRICFAGHGTRLQDSAGLTERYYAYQERRARGGAGMIVTEIVMIDPSTKWNPGSLTIDTETKVSQFSELARRLHAHDCKVLAQLFHPGMDRQFSDDGTRPVILSASEVRGEFRKIATRALTLDQIEELLSRYVTAAVNMQQAGLDGVEISASHGYLPAQFLHPDCNRRNDEYGGDIENRARFLREIALRIRRACGPQFAVGVRLSSGGVGLDALPEADVLSASQLMAADRTVDYLSITDGASASGSDVKWNVAPMGTPELPKRSLARKMKEASGLPVIVTGRATSPGLAENVVVSGDADMVGMVRALICDPDFGMKLSENRPEDIRVCIGCNQACIGHNHNGFPISCIQNPVTGRETRYDMLVPAADPKRVLVVGGGPAGMKAAETAALRGHKVTLVEATDSLGGQALLAQQLPGRSEFGGLVTNLEHSLRKLQVDVQLRIRVDARYLRDRDDHCLVLATGGTPFIPETYGEGRALHSSEVIARRAQPGHRVVIVDWSCDWVAIGLSERLASEGHDVRVAVNGSQAGSQIQRYSAFAMLGRAMRVGATFTPFLRYFGFEDGTAYFENILTGEAVTWSDVDDVVLCYGYQSESSLSDELSDLTVDVHQVGDCLQPRTAEEAIWDGFRVAATI